MKNGVELKVRLVGALVKGGRKVAEVKEKTLGTYKCGCCGTEFGSYVNKAGPRLCQNCVELRRALKGFLKRGLSAAEVMKRGKKLLGNGKPVKAEPVVETTE